MMTGRCNKLSGFLLVLVLLLQACASRPVAVNSAEVSLGTGAGLDAGVGAAYIESKSSLQMFPAVRQVAADLGLAAPSKQSGMSTLPVWQHYKFPGKQPTQYSYTPVDGTPAVMASASSSASMLRQSVRIEPALLRDVVFSWKVAQLIPGADLALREAHDSPVRLVLAFEGDRGEFSMKNAMLSELSLTLTGEPMPYATLMYVWCNDCAKEALYLSPRTDRIREIAVETGPENVGRWLSYRRDVQADYLKAYGQPPGALVGIGIMTDTDNTRQSAVAWYGPISLTTPSSK